jgi:hypothetical protein
MIRSALLMLVLVGPLCAAPAPFEQPRKRSPLARNDLVGSWEALWGGVRCRITLAESGDYVCNWCGTRYVGTWGMDRDGRIWITESCRPGESLTWQQYAVRLAGRGDLRGPIEVGANGVVIQLERICSPPPPRFDGLSVHHVADE